MDFHYRFNFDGYPQRHTGRADRSARMRAMLTKYFEKQLGCTIDDRADLSEVRQAVDEPADARDPYDAIEIVVQRRARLRQYVQRR